MTLLASNLLLQLPETASEREASAALLAEVESLLACRAASNAHWLIVSNEVGLGLVSPCLLGRICRDVLGRANQKLAAAATEALFLVAGMPIGMKR